MFGNKEITNKSKFMERNLLAKNTTLVGDLSSEGDFRIDGTLEGTLKTKGRVIIGVEGVIKGTVECENADVEGRFSGTLKVDKMLTIKATAKITGEVVLGKLSVEPGATFNASCAMKGAIKELNKERGELQEKQKSNSEQQQGEQPA